MMRVYIETTIFNRYFEDGREYNAENVQLFEEIKRGKIDAFTSSFVIQELEDAQEPKREKMLRLIPDFNIKILEYDVKAYDLADLYIQMGVIPQKSRVDGTHIAMAAMHDMDCIVSLNFRHINRLKTKTATEVIHRMKNFSNPSICTPMEVINYE